MDTILLIGTEEVRSAGYAMERAAREIQSAAASLEYTLQRHQQWMDEWLLQFQAVMEAKNGKSVQGS